MAYEESLALFMLRTRCRNIVILAIRAEGAKNRREGKARMSGTKSRYIPALDGLRAFAVLAVIAYHLGMQWAPGGLLGVTVFFVLSG